MVSWEEGQGLVLRGSLTVLRRRCRRGQRRPCPLPGGGGGASGAGGGSTGGPPGAPGGSTGCRQSRPVSAWELILASFSGCFTAPSFALFAELVSAWVCSPARRTVCGIVATMDPASGPVHDAYHRFLRAGAWSLRGLFEVLARLIVGALCPTGTLAVDIDDTLFNKSGPRVAGAGNFRDPIRSTANKVVYALGLNIVVATLRITAPWGGEPLGLPVNMRLYRKGAAATSSLPRT